MGYTDFNIMRNISYPKHHSILFEFCKHLYCLQEEKRDWENDASMFSFKKYSVIDNTTNIIQNKIIHSELK